MTRKWTGSFLLALTMLISILLMSCGSDSTGKNTFFVGLIDEVNDSTILVKVVEAEYKMTDEIIIPVDNPETYLVGEMVRITFDGNVDETYPAQINKPDSIEILSTSEATEIVSFETAKAEGAYGSISLEIPSDWTYTSCGVDDDRLTSASYGIQYHPADETTGFIEVGYTSMFGVCGTGLETKNETIAGEDATIGYYEGSANWSYVTFSGDNEKIVALAVDADVWSQEEMNTALEILDTLVFNQNEQSGAIYVDTDESFIDKYSLEVSAKNITSTSATLVFTRMDASITDELTFGEEFTIDKKDGDEWKEADPVIDGDYGFKSVAYTIAVEGSTEHDFDWELLYGALEPGEYRINLQVEDEPVSVHFVLR